jgi:hypothetical protein
MKPFLFLCLLIRLTVLTGLPFVLFANSADASSVTLAWNADLPTGNPAANTAGYRLHLGLASGVYTQSTTLGNVTAVKVSNLISGVKYYFAVTAYNSAGLDSPPSYEVSYIAP